MKALATAVMAAVLTTLLMVGVTLAGAPDQVVPSPQPGAHITGLNGSASHQPQPAPDAPTESRTHYTLDFVGELSTDNQDAYLAGLVDGLRFAAGWPTDRTKMVAGCMEGFPSHQLRERAFSNAERSGLRHFDATVLAADAVIARLSWDCQLQWTAPSGQISRQFR